MMALGKHILAEYKLCDSLILNDIQKIENLLLNAAKEAETFVLGSSFHRFEPHGVSGVVVISESHLSIHTWPEFSYAAVDIFTCGDDVNPEASFEFLKQGLNSNDASFKTIMRGEQLC
jgi:S-adenosylmethionine decarboxylase